jgi:predicted RNA-binding protein (virulence factor B family)
MKCRTWGCKNKKSRRGVCHACYSAVYRAVEAGTLTWAEAERRGLVAKSERPRSPMAERIAKLCK